MVKKTAVILGILAMMLALGAGMSWGYTVSKWPVPGIPNVAYEPGGACWPGGAGGGDFTLRGPVAPACEPPLLPGLLHGALAAPMAPFGLLGTPLFTGGPVALGGGGCCNVELGDPAYVVAAVPCTAVSRYVPPCGY